jgi:hypothetical protein
MFEALAMSIVAVAAGASLTFLCAILLPEDYAKKNADSGRFSGLGAAPVPVHTRAARARRERRVRRGGHALP